MISIKLTVFGCEVYQDGSFVEYISFLESVNPFYDLPSEARWEIASM